MSRPPQQGVQYPGISWVVYVPTPAGWYVRCHACNATAGPLSAPGLHQFAAAHREHRSTAGTHYGAGDAIAALTKAVGMTPCTPCEQRRRALNGLVPRFWRR